MAVERNKWENMPQISPVLQTTYCATRAAEREPQLALRLKSGQGSVLFRRFPAENPGRNFSVEIVFIEP
jgi:hypothetical protein